MIWRILSNNISTYQHIIERPNKRTHLQTVQTLESPLQIISKGHTTEDRVCIVSTDTGPHDHVRTIFRVDSSWKDRFHSSRLKRQGDMWILVQPVPSGEILRKVRALRKGMEVLW